MIRSDPRLVGLSRFRFGQQRFGSEIGFFRLLEHFEMVESPADVDVSSDVVLLDAHRGLEEFQSLLVFPLALECVAHIVK
jgi:hypothetical protein